MVRAARQPRWRPSHLTWLALVIGVLLSVAISAGLVVAAGASQPPASRVATQPGVTPVTGRDSLAPSDTAAPAAPPTTTAVARSAPRAPTSPRRPATTPAPRTATPPPTARTAPSVVPTVTPPPATSTGSSSDFALLGYRWNPCHSVTVASTGPDVSTIVSELATITGLRLQLVSGPAEITVGWGAVPAGGEVGQTNWAATGRWMVQATITISSAAPAQYLPSVLRHELGHALGLNHATQSNEVMYPLVGSGSPMDYQAGDLAGLHAVGASGGC